MVTPRVKVLRSIPIAWTPPTEGALTAPVVLAPMRRERDFAKWKGTLRGKIVLVSKPERSTEPDKPAFKRLTDDDLDELSEYQQPRHSEAEIARTLKEAQFDDRLDAFLAEEGALAWVRMSYRDAGLVTGEGYGHRVGLTPKLPGIELAAEDYRQLARLTRTDAAPTIEIISDVKYHDEDTKAYNVIADIPGRDPKAGYVMAGAHLDSWVAADGAGDNAAGSAVVMEAARILSKLGIRPKRTIRFALWSGEEQVLGGSLAYIEQHLATRAPSTDPVANELHPYYGWQNRWPITPSPGYYDLAAYFNVDNGSGKIRGIYAEGNPAVVPIFREWFEPFESMGAATISAQRTGDTDHELMQAVGIPAFQFIQDPLDYGARVHHSSIDSYDHLRIEDLKQAAVILAILPAQCRESRRVVAAHAATDQAVGHGPLRVRGSGRRGQYGGIAGRSRDHPKLSRRIESVGKSPMSKGKDGGQGRNRITDTPIFSLGSIFETVTVSREAHGEDHEQVQVDTRVCARSRQLDGVRPSLSD